MAGAVKIAALVGATLVGAGAGVSRPPAPTVTGARVVSGPVVSLRFSVPAQRARFRCSFDSPRLHPCPSRLRVTLSPGRHLLRVQAVDRQGRIGPQVRVFVITAAPSIRVGRGPVNLAVGAGSVWISNIEAGTVSRVDAASGRVGATIAVGGKPAGVAATDTAVWVGNFATPVLTRIDPARNAVAARIDLGGLPLGPAVAPDGAVWV